MKTTEWLKKAENLTQTVNKVAYVPMLDQSNWTSPFTMAIGVPMLVIAGVMLLTALTQLS